MTAFLVQDFPALAAGMLASIACALVGCFLVLRRMSLMGDAISHAVLPGIVLAFLLADSLAALPVFIGAAAVGVVTAGLTELIHRLGKVESGASMGVVFTVLFALGVLMLERTGGRSIHLDADCVLYGAMENVLWTSAPSGWRDIIAADAGSGFQQQVIAIGANLMLNVLFATTDFPRQIVTLGIVLALNVIFVVALFKELRITSFDPGLAKAQGINPSLMHYLLMTMVAITTVASFEAVGSILVVAMLIVPGLCAHLLSDRLSSMLWLSALVAAIASSGGYAAAAKMNVNGAGMIGVTLGVVLAIVAIFAPRHGWLARVRAGSGLQPQNL
jgi:manganese/zinc/iron transport system permease protein